MWDRKEVNLTQKLFSVLCPFHTGSLVCWRGQGENCKQSKPNYINLLNEINPEPKVLEKAIDFCYLNVLHTNWCINMMMQYWTPVVLSVFEIIRDNLALAVSTFSEIFFGWSFALNLFFWMIGSPTLVHQRRWVLKYPVEVCVCDFLNQGTFLRLYLGPWLLSFFWLCSGRAFQEIYCHVLVIGRYWWLFCF